MAQDSAPSLAAPHALTHANPGPASRMPNGDPLCPAFLRGGMVIFLSHNRAQSTVLKSRTYQVQDTSQTCPKHPR
eukprot:4093549-Prymnesium_polylepis.1